MVNTNTRIIKAVLLAFFISCNLFVFIPFTLYYGNTGEFVLSLADIFKVNIYLILSVICMVIVIGGFLKEVSYRRYLSFLSAVGILIWLQGNILVWEYGRFDGHGIVWDRYSWMRNIDIVIWVSILALSIIKYQKLGNILFKFSIIIFAGQFITFTYTSMAHYHDVYQKPQISNVTQSLENIYQFSKSKNVLHLLLDGFQSDIFEEIINDEKYGAIYKNHLNGFTFYKENTGVFQSTHMSVPAIMSEKIYKNHKPMGKFVDEVFSGETILNAVYRAGYEVDIVSDTPMIGVYTKGKYTNSYIIPNNYHVNGKQYLLDDVTRLLDLTLFRVSPHFFKKYIYNDQRWFVKPLFMDEEYLQYSYFSHTAFLYDLIKKMKVTREASVYKYLHLMNTHWPMVVNPDCSYAGVAYIIVRKSVRAQSRCTLNTLLMLFDKLKELGIYDDTLIVLHADHGADVDPYRFKPFKIEYAGITAPVNPSVVSIETPVLAIKLPGSKGPLEESSLLTSLLDLPKTISTLLNIDNEFNGISIYDLPLKQPRERNVYHYMWEEGDWEADYTSVITEFIVTGSIYNGDWRVGNIYTRPDS